MPIGVLAIVASAAGTMSLEELGWLQVYLLIYVAMALLLTLWVLPAMITSLTSLTYRQVVGQTRDISPLQKRHYKTLRSADLRQIGSLKCLPQVDHILPHDAEQIAARRHIANWIKNQAADPLPRVRSLATTSARGM